jgi:Bacterial alpha-L-rhamnosidase C-terminal domain/Bacterial alpha-L-rhamnosidase 6 hairpin glycosidase domain
VLAPVSSTVYPIAIASTAGGVDAATNLLHPKGVTTLTMRPGEKEPVVLLDYGKDVGGKPFVQVAGTKGSPTLRLSFSEAEQFATAVGDNGGKGPCCGFAPPAADPYRYDNFQPRGAASLTTTYLQGGERFERIALTTPGTITLRGVGIHFTAFLAHPSSYQGWFLSSDNLLNRLWYAGAYTVQLDMVPPGAQNNNVEPVIVDGAKRDRAIWSGDLLVEGPTVWATLGTNGANYVKQSLLQLVTHQSASGLLPGLNSVGSNPLSVDFSLTYSMDAANAMVDYYRYSGDQAFAKTILPVVERQLAADRAFLDARGLLDTPVPDPSAGCIGQCAQDWDAYDPPKAGEVAEYNIIYFHSLEEATYLEANVGTATLEASDTADASALASRINAYLWNPATKQYRLSNQRPNVEAQDADALGVFYGVVPPSRQQEILSALKNSLWTKYGVRPFSLNSGYSEVMSPYVTGFETAARLEVGDTSDALTLFSKLWGPMVEKGPSSTGALWEKVSATGGVAVKTGTDPIDNNSLAHGWSSGPTWQLSQYVLGPAPVGPGYHTWTVEPHVGDLNWAKGQVPTPYGPLGVSWGKSTHEFRLQVNAPTQTSGIVDLPSHSGRDHLTVDGRQVQDTAAVHLGAGTHVIILSFRRVNTTSPA